MHCQLLAAHLILFIVLNGALNISFQASSVTLPTSLRYPITTIYDNKLIVIPNNITNQTYTLSSFASHVIANSNPTINFTSIETQQPLFWRKPITCDNLIVSGFDQLPSENHKCYAAKDELLYIPQRRQRPNWDWTLIIYNMSSLTYITHDNPPLGLELEYDQFIMCTYIIDNMFVILGGVQFLELYKYIYYLNTSSWTQENDYFAASSSVTAKGGTACELVYDYLYIFGGYNDEGTVLKYGSKCPGEPGNWDCVLLTEGMEYRRNAPFMSLILDHYLLIYGGTSSTGNFVEEMELFDTSIDAFITTTIPNQLPLLDMKSFRPLTVSGNIIAFIGGRDSETDENVKSIEYLDLSNVFDEVIVLEIPPCITTYFADNEAWFKVDDTYFFDEDIMWFEAHDIVTNEIGMYIGFETSHEEEFYVWVYPDRVETWSWSLEDLQLGFNEDVIFDMENVSSATGINMTDDYYVFWMTLENVIDIGFGINPTQFSTMLDVTNGISVASLSLKGAIFSFRSDSCSLNMSVDNKEKFIIGDFVQLFSNLELKQATSLDSSIFLKSYDMIDFEYIVTIEIIQDHSPGSKAISNCTLCRMNNGNVNESSCNGCNQGIEVYISGVYDYSIWNNQYEIIITSSEREQVYSGSISTQFERFYPKSIVLQRVIPEITFDVILSSVNNASGIYPNSEISIIPNYDKTNPVQPNGLFIISFDESLSFEDNSAIMFIDFYEDTCDLMYDNWTINCYEESIIIPITMEFKNINNNLYHFLLNSSDTNITGDTLYEFSRNIQTLSVQFSKEIYLGQVIDVFINISDHQIFNEETAITVANDMYNIYSIIDISYNLAEGITTGNAIVSCKIVSPNIDLETGCDEGIPFRATTTDIMDQYIILNISSDDTYIQQYRQKLFINQCNIGNEIAGSASTAFECIECEFGSVGLISNSKCIYCEENNGIQCMGSTNLIISYNYWVEIKSDQNIIISNFCPTGYCCPNVNGCEYAQSMKSEYRLCAMGRNESVPLCGKCMKGYSEVFGSSHCKKCSKDNYWLLLVPTVVAVLFVFVLLIIDPPPKPYTDKEFNYAVQLLKDDMKAIQLSVLRPLLYFSQALNYVSIQNGLFFYLAPLTRLLSLDIFEATNDDTDRTGVCFINGLTSINKQFWNLFFPICMFISIGLFALINLCTRKRIRFLNFGMNVVVSMLILLVANIISTMLKVVACSEVDGDYVHFYSGDTVCFGGIWWFALISIMVIIMFWMAIFVKLYRIDEEKRDSRHSPLRSVTKSFKNNKWFWEFVLLSRRIIIPFMVTIQYIDYKVTQYILLLIIVIYFGIQCKYNPFVYDRANTMEILTLFLLFVALSIIISEFHLQHPKAISIIISIVVVLPLLLLVFYMFMAVRNFLNIRNNPNAENNIKHQKRKEKWGSRQTPSQLKLVNLESEGGSGLKTHQQSKVEMTTANGTEMMIADAKRESVEKQIISNTKITKTEKIHSDGDDEEESNTIQQTVDGSAHDVCEALSSAKNS